MAVDLHLQWPFRQAGAVGLLPGETVIPAETLLPRGQAPGTFSVVEQDTLADVKQCIHVLVKTPLGWRPLAPDVGIVDPLWLEGIDTDALAGSLVEWEPRAAVSVTTGGPDGDGRQTVQINVDLAEEA
jgi:phage baseplate assembly protein W